MIGVFDSGMGGRVTLGYLEQELPEYQYLYLGDTKYLPYGTKDPQFLQERTFECLEWMFGQWCQLIIMACNTASAYAIRPWQEQYPDRKVLSVTVPGVESIVAHDLHRPVILGTEATIQSGIYPSVMERLLPEYTCTFVPLIGKWVVDRLERGIGTFELVQNLFGTIRNIDYDWVVLACTHYPLIADEIQEIVGKYIPVLDPGLESVHTLRKYLDRHPEIALHQESRQSEKKKSLLYVTGEGDSPLLHVDL